MTYCKKQLTLCSLNCIRTYLSLSPRKSPKTCWNSK